MSHTHRSFNENLKCAIRPTEWCSWMQPGLEIKFSCGIYEINKILSAFSDTMAFGAQLTWPWRRDSLRTLRQKKYYCPHIYPADVLGLKWLGLLTNFSFRSVCVRMCLCVCACACVCVHVRACMCMCDWCRHLSHVFSFVVCTADSFTLASLYFKTSTFSFY